MSYILPDILPCSSIFLLLSQQARKSASIPICNVHLTQSAFYLQTLSFLYSIFFVTVMDSSIMQSHQSASVDAQEAFKSQFDMDNPLAAMNSYSQYVPIL